MSAPLTAELFARAIVAAARNYGDDPLAACAAKPGANQRRAFAPATYALAQATGASRLRVCRILGVSSEGSRQAKTRGGARFVKAQEAAREAVSYHLRGLELTARAQPGTEPAGEPEQIAPASISIPVWTDVVVFEVEPAPVAHQTEIDLRNPAGEKIPSCQGGARAAEAVTGDTPVASAPTITKPAPHPVTSRPASKPAAKRGRAIPKDAKFENRGEGVSVIRLKPITDSIIRHAQQQADRGADVDELADLFGVDPEQLRRRLKEGAAA